MISPSKLPPVFSEMGLFSRGVPLWRCGLITITTHICEQLLTFQSIPPSIIPLYPPDSLVMQVEPGLSGPAFRVSKAGYVLSGSGAQEGTNHLRSPPNKLHLKISLIKTAFPFHNADKAQGVNTHWPKDNSSASVHCEVKLQVSLSWEQILIGGKNGPPKGNGGNFRSQFCLLLLVRIFNPIL